LLSISESSVCLNASVKMSALESTFLLFQWFTRSFSPCFLSSFTEYFLFKKNKQANTPNIDEQAACLAGEKKKKTNQTTTTRKTNKEAQRNTPCSYAQPNTPYSCPSLALPLLPPPQLC